MYYQYYKIYNTGNTGIVNITILVIPVSRPAASYYPNNIEIVFSITFGRNIYLYQDHDALVSNTQMAIRSTYKIFTELEEKFENLKSIIRSRKSKKDRQY